MSYFKKRLTEIVQEATGQKQIPAGHDDSLEVRREPIGTAAGRGVDLVFVIDTTGSMSDKIEGLLTTCAKFVEDFNTLRLNHRIAIVSFGDLRVPGDKIQNTAFTSSVAVTQKSLRHIPRNGGGGNEGESSLEALERALSMPFRPDAVKVIVLITDEPADQHRLRADDMLGKLVERECLVFVASSPQGYYKKMATFNGGKWYKISAHTNFNDLLNMFKDLSRKVSQVVSDVYQVGDGSVASYLKLKPPEK
jgi:hypothetical protein